MINTLRQQNRKTGLSLIIAASVAVVLALSLNSFGQRDRAFDPVPLLTELKSSAVTEVRVWSVDERYTLRKSNEGLWIAVEAADFPVRTEAIEDLLQSLAIAHKDKRSTVFPERYDELGVSDPRLGGTGAEVTLVTGTGEEASLILGLKNGRSFVRQPDKKQVYRLSEAMPPFHRKRWWLDLEAVTLPALAVIEGVDLRFPDGRTFLIQDIDNGAFVEFGENEGVLRESIWRLMSGALSAPEIIDVLDQDIFLGEPLFSATLWGTDGQPAEVSFLRSSNGDIWMAFDDVEQSPEQIVLTGRLFRPAPTSVGWVNSIEPALVRAVSNPDR